MRSPTTLTRSAVAVFAALLIVALAPAAAPGAVSDPCGLVTQFDTAHAFGLKNAEKSSVVVRAPGNTAGVVRVRCRALAWTGRKPANDKQQRMKLVDGTLATLRVESWVTDPGPHEATWLGNFAAKIKGLTSRARAQFVGGPLDGSSFPPPKFGAGRSLGFTAMTSNLNKLRSFWWDQDSGAIISISAVQARGKPTIASVNRFAKIAVRGSFSG